MKTLDATSETAAEVEDFEIQPHVRCGACGDSVNAGDYVIKGMAHGFYLLDNMLEDNFADFLSELSRRWQNFRNPRQAEGSIREERSIPQPH